MIRPCALFPAAFLLVVVAQAGTPEEVETPDTTVEIESAISNEYQSEGRDTVEGLFMSNSIEAE
jgi:hypothetical protein